MAVSPLALVPLRAPGTGKTRLAPALSPEQRAALAGAMLADVCAALSAAGIDRIVVAAGGASAAAAAAALGVDVLLDPPGTAGLDQALRSASLQLGPVPALLVVTADLPRLTAPDVHALVEVDAPVVIAPTTDGGTGGLLRRPSDAIATAYGRGSAARHRRAASRAGLRAEVVTTPGFADVDTLSDLTGLGRGHVGPATRAALTRLDPPVGRTG